MIKKEKKPKEKYTKCAFHKKLPSAAGTTHLNSPSVFEVSTTLSVDIDYFSNKHMQNPELKTCLCTGAFLHCKKAQIKK